MSARAAQVDDHHVEVADRGQQLESAGAALGLLHLVAVRERLAHTQPDGGLRIYDQAASVVVHSFTPTVVPIPAQTASTAT
jgi:hypothetical protein